MKKLLALLLTAVMLTAAACGGTPSHGDSYDEKDGGPSFVTYEVKLDSGTVIPVGGNAAKVIAALGEHIDYMEAPSCVHEGSDKVYTYDGYTVTTSPYAGGYEYVAEFALTSDVAALDNGVYIGCTADEVKAAFGDTFEESFGVIKYTLDGAVISIVTDGGAVTALTVSAIVE